MFQKMLEYYQSFWHDLVCIATKLTISIVKSSAKKRNTAEDGDRRPYYILNMIRYNCDKG